MGDEHSSLNNVWYVEWLLEWQIAVHKANEDWKEVLPVLWDYGFSLSVLLGCYAGLWAVILPVSCFRGCSPWCRLSRCPAPSPIHRTVVM